MQFHQRIVAFDLMRFTAGHVESQRIALGVRAEMDFGREAATRAAERFLILIPPFTPAACWCALTMVESMACSLSAGGPRLALRGQLSAATLLKVIDDRLLVFAVWSRVQVPDRTSLLKRKVNFLLGQLSAATLLKVVDERIRRPTNFLVIVFDSALSIDADSTDATGALVLRRGVAHGAQPHHDALAAGARARLETHASLLLD